MALAIGRERTLARDPIDEIVLDEQNADFVRLDHFVPARSRQGSSLSDQ
jgi:hypothetical protein